MLAARPSVSRWKGLANLKSLLVNILLVGRIVDALAGCRGVMELLARLLLGRW